MAVTCPKCEFVNEAGTGKPMEACPQCGVIYQRAALAAAQQKLQEATRSRVESSKPATTGPGFIERVGWYVCIVGSRYGCGHADRHHGHSRKLAAAGRWRRPRAGLGSYPLLPGACNSARGATLGTSQRPAAPRHPW